MDGQARLCACHRTVEPRGSTGLGETCGTGSPAEGIRVPGPETTRSGKIGITGLPHGRAGWKDGRLGADSAGADPDADGAEPGSVDPANHDGSFCTDSLKTSSDPWEAAEPG